jgi:apolipoprotein N-acyltransferase
MIVPLIQWVLRASTLGVKQLRHEADHSTVSNDEVKNVWSYTSTPQYVIMVWCLVKHRDNFTFTLVVPFFIFKLYLLLALYCFLFQIIVNKSVQ